MCYSAMVNQNAKELSFKFKARIQTELYEDLFQRRSVGEKLYLNKAMEQTFTQNAQTPQEIKIKKLILDWHHEQITLIEQEIFKQSTRKAEAERGLKTKITKKAQNELRISTNKIAKIKKDLDKHKTTDIVNESEARIFPLHYMTMLALDEQGQRVLRPVRYLMRPHGKDENFDVKFNGCYNARFDGLESVPWWRDSFGKRHGIILVRKFYENVAVSDYQRGHQLEVAGLERDNIVLCFEPDNVEYMVIPTLWDYWEKPGQPGFYSAALITDDPAPEILATGHDRTPIFLKESAIDSWLNASGITTQELKEILGQRDHPHYSHSVTGVA